MMDVSEHLKVLTSAFGALVITFVAMVAVASPDGGIEQARTAIVASQPAD
jgi:hypothetical protein